MSRILNQGMEIHRINTSRFSAMVCPLTGLEIGWRQDRLPEGCVVAGVLSANAPEQLGQIRDPSLASAWDRFVTPARARSETASACGLLYGFQHDGLVALEVTDPDAPCCHPGATRYFLLPGQWLGRLRWVTA